MYKNTLLFVFIAFVFGWIGLVSPANAQEDYGMSFSVIYETYGSIGRLQLTDLKGNPLASRKVHLKATLLEVSSFDCNGLNNTEKARDTRYGIEYTCVPLKDSNLSKVKNIELMKMLEDDYMTNSKGYFEINNFIPVGSILYTLTVDGDGNYISKTKSYIVGSVYKYPCTIEPTVKKEQLHHLVKRGEKIAFDFDSERSNCPYAKKDMSYTVSFKAANFEQQAVVTEDEKNKENAGKTGNIFHVEFNPGTPFPFDHGHFYIKNTTKSLAEDAGHENVDIGGLNNRLIEVNRETSLYKSTLSDIVANRYIIYGWFSGTERSEMYIASDLFDARDNELNDMEIYFYDKLFKDGIAIEDNLFSTYISIASENTHIPFKNKDIQEEMKISICFDDGCVDVDKIKANDTASLFEYNLRFMAPHRKYGKAKIFIYINGISYYENGIEIELPESHFLRNVGIALIVLVGLAIGFALLRSLKKQHDKYENIPSVPDSKSADLKEKRDFVLACFKQVSKELVGREIAWSGKAVETFYHAVETHPNRKQAEKFCTMVYKAMNAKSISDADLKDIRSLAIKMIM